MMNYVTPNDGSDIKILSRSIIIHFNYIHIQYYLHYYITICTFYSNLYQKNNFVTFHLLKLAGICKLHLDMVLVYHPGVPSITIPVIRCNLQVAKPNDYYTRNLVYT